VSSKKSKSCSNFNINPHHPVLGRSNKPRSLEGTYWSRVRRRRCKMRELKKLMNSCSTTSRSTSRDACLSPFFKNNKMMPLSVLQRGLYRKSNSLHWMWLRPRNLCKESRRVIKTVRMYKGLFRNRLQWSHPKQCTFLNSWYRIPRRTKNCSTSHQSALAMSRLLVELPKVLPRSWTRSALVQVPVWILWRITRLRVVAWSTSHSPLA